MGITVRGPFSGQPVKIRDQDVGRAVRDEEGRIFYALPKSDGSGYYGAPTRAGGAKDEQRALEMETKAGQVAQTVKRLDEAHTHDATGRRRGRLLTKLVMLLIVLAACAAGYVYWTGGDDLKRILPSSGPGTTDTEITPGPESIPGNPPDNP